jgi:hypothetical protein
MGLFSDEDSESSDGGGGDLMMMLLLFSLLPQMMRGFQPSQQLPPIYNIYLKKKDGNDEDGGLGPYDYGSPINETPFSHFLPGEGSNYEMGHFPGGGAREPIIRYIYPIGGGGDPGFVIGSE